MQKFLKLLYIGVLALFLTGCFRSDKLKNNNVYTTVYPIKYLTDYLYGNNKNVLSIYPNGADITTYRLTDKQREEYQKGALFVYNGLTKEKTLAQNFLNENDKMLLIDVAYGLNYEYAVEELWLSPNNFLMLAKNLKNNLIEYTTSKTLKSSIEKNYGALEETLSYMDADLRNIANLAKNNNSNQIVVSSNKLAYLRNYGFDVIVLDSENINEDIIRNNFKSGTYKDLYLCDTDNKNNFITSLEEAGANIINVEVMNTLTDEEDNNNEDYLTIMNGFIENIRNTTLS